MSSSAYSACLTTDRRLRIIVIASGAVFAVGGLCLLVTMPFEPQIRSMACLLWAAVSLAGLRRFHRGYGRYCRIRLLADGGVELRNSDEEWFAAELQDGSVVLRRIAWLRFKMADGSQVEELMYGDARRCTEWRRLQVIWRHVGAAG